jgi:16S rRNA (cytosine967-C5)-methyltransferase
MQAANEAPPLVARVNALRGTREDAQRMLARGGVEAAPLAAPMALDLSGQDPAGIPGAGEGWFYFQDQGSQWLGYLADPQPGQTCVDYCSAPGGKATHWAELMRDQGVVWAHDRSAAKLARVRENAKRLALSCIKTATTLPQGLSADRVLVDAPCSGLGTLRRHAEGRWRILENDLERLSGGQKKLLAQAAGFVKRGGHLIYATCTTEPEENEAVVTAFLAAHPGFELKPGPGTSGHPSKAYWDADGFFRTFPGHPDMDAMFAARLLRKA